MNILNYFLVDFLTDLYIHGESTYEFVEQGKLKTVSVNRSESWYPHSRCYISVQNNLWFMGAGYLWKYPYDALIGGNLLRYFIK